MYCFVGSTLKSPHPSTISFTFFWAWSQLISHLAIMVRSPPCLDFLMSFVLINLYSARSNWSSYAHWKAAQSPLGVFLTFHLAIFEKKQIVQNQPWVSRSAESLLHVQSSALETDDLRWASRVWYTVAPPLDII